MRRGRLWGFEWRLGQKEDSDLTQRTLREITEFTE
jgi:hypothetical protein